jgi:hypothetical protein
MSEPLIFTKTERKRKRVPDDVLEILAEPGRVALKMPAEPGVKTVVRDDSAKDLPTDQDRTPEQNLPLPGSATPGGAGRDIPRFEYNTPDNDIDKRPRTLGVPGEDYGHPVKEDYGTVTRRSMTAAEIAVETVLLRMAAAEDPGFDKEAYRQRWRPGVRQRRSRGRDRQKRRLYNRKNRNKRKRNSRLWRRKNRNNGALKVSNKRRRRSNRKRRGSLEEGMALRVVERFAREDRNEHAPPAERGGPDGKRQREQPSEKKRQDARYYDQNSAKRQRQSDRQYIECMRDNNCKKRRKEYRANPGYYERGSPMRRRAELLTVPEIAFGIGPDMELGYVRSISPMTGMVTFETDGDNHRVWESLPVEVFLRVAAFLSDEDIDSFFELVDAEIGGEAYEDIDEEGLRECAALYDTDPDSDEFRAKCFELTGEEDLSNLSAEQMDAVNDRLVLGILEGGGEPDEGAGRAHGDDSISDEYDPHLYYGEVEMEKAFKEASAKLKWEPTHDYWDGTKRVLKQVAQSRDHQWEIRRTGEHPQLGMAHKMKRSWVKVFRDGKQFGKPHGSLRAAQRHVQEWVDEYER